MTTMEQRLLDFSIGKGIDENTAEFRPFWVSVKELREVYPLRSDRAYAEICQAADALLSMKVDVVRFEEPTKRRLINLFSTCDYEVGQGTDLGEV